MSLVVAMVPSARLLISGGNGRTFILSYNSFGRLMRFVLLMYRHPGNGNGLHALQVQIAMRGIFGEKLLLRISI